MRRAPIFPAVNYLRGPVVLWLAGVSWLLSACSASEQHAPRDTRLGQWIWTRTDLARFAESAIAHPELEAGVFIGSVTCDAASGQLTARAGLSAGLPESRAVTAVIRFEEGLDRCRTVNDTAHRFEAQLDSAVVVLRARARSTPLEAMQLDYDAPQRGIRAWAASVGFLRAHALRGDSVWVTSLIAQLREPEYGHVLQVFDTGEPATDAQVREALRLAARARMPFRLGVGAFERELRTGRTDHRAWFGAITQFAAVDGYRGVWVFPAGNRWVSYLRERV
jgi:hypothetical protein